MSQITSSGGGGASGGILTLTTDDLNVVSPDGAGNINLVGAHGLNTSGAVANEASVQINNAITLGDLANIAAGADALTISTGDITFSATNNVGNLEFPSTHSSGDAGVIKFDSARFFHTGPIASPDSVFVGRNSGNFTNTAGRSTGVGHNTLQSLTSGGQNTSVGSNSMFGCTTGTQNIAMGLDALDDVLTGDGNVALGMQALTVTTIGEWNVAVGRSAMVALISGSRNVAIGGGEDGTSGTLYQLTTGSFNVAIGGNLTTSTGGAGSAYTGSESSNICIGNATIGTVGENNVMRIGTTGSSGGQVNKAFIAGAHGITPAGATQTVIIDSAGQLGSTASSGGGITWNEETTTSVTMAVDNGYISNNAGLVTLTLPDTAALGSVIRVVGKGAGGWLIAQNAGESIRWDESTVTTTGVGGSLASSDDYDSVEILCTTADVVWTVLSSKGNITVV